MSNDVATLNPPSRVEALYNECSRLDGGIYSTHRKLIPSEVTSSYTDSFEDAAQCGVFRYGYPPCVVPDPILLEKMLEGLREPTGGVGFREALKRRRRYVIAFGLGATALAEPAVVPLVDTTYPVDSFLVKSGVALTGVFATLIANRQQKRKFIKNEGEYLADNINEIFELHNRPEYIIFTADISIPYDGATAPKTVTTLDGNNQVTLEELMTLAKVELSKNSEGSVLTAFINEEAIAKSLNPQNKTDEDIQGHIVDTLRYLGEMRKNIEERKEVDRELWRLKGLSEIAGTNGVNIGEDITKKKEEHAELSKRAMYDTALPYLATLLIASKKLRLRLFQEELIGITNMFIEEPDWTPDMRSEAKNFLDKIFSALIEKPSESVDDAKNTELLKDLKLFSSLTNIEHLRECIKGFQVKHWEYVYAKPKEEVQPDLAITQ